MRNATSRRITVLATALSVLLLGGVVFAAWTSNGAGSGSASSGEDIASTITAVVESQSGDLYPGADETIEVNINNPNEYPVVVTSISDGGSLEVDGCVADSVFSDAREFDGSGLLQSDGETKTIAADGNANYTLRVRMIGDAHNDCKDGDFGLALTATLVSVATTAAD